MSDSIIWTARLWGEFSSANLWDKASILCGLMGLVGVPSLAHAIVSGTMASTLRKAKEAALVLATDAEQETSKLDRQLSATLDVCARECLSDVLRLARASSPAVRARILTDTFEANAPVVGRLARERLALALRSESSSNDDDNELAYLLTIARSLDPDPAKRESDEAARRTMSARANLQYLGPIPNTDGRTEDEVRSQVVALIHRARAACADLDYVTALLLAREARMLSEAAGARLYQETLVSRHEEVRALVGVDLPAALVAIEELIPLWRDHEGGFGQNTLVNCSLRIQILIEAGLNELALEMSDSLLPLKEALWGEDGRGTLVSRYDRARALSALGNAERALAEVDDMIPRWKKLEGEAGYNTIQNRLLRANVLFESGRDEEALIEIDDLLSLLRREYGNQHAFTLKAQVYRAMQLYRQRREGTLDDIGELMRQAEAVFGGNHELVSRCRILCIQLLRDSGRVEEANAALKLVPEAFIRNNTFQASVLTAK